jgi:glutathione S-transferase
MRIWGRRSSFNVQKVLWLLGELGLTYEHTLAGGSFGGLDTPEFRAMNPHGRVPVLQDSDVVIWESHAIMRYLAAQYGGARFWSDEPASRSCIDRWMDWSQTSVQPDFLNGVFWGYYRTPEPLRDWTAIHKNVARCASHFQLLDAQLRDNEFVTGADLTLADIPLGTSLYRYFGLDIDRPSLPHVERWYQRLQERSSYRAHVMVPFDELRGRLAY